MMPSRSGFVAVTGSTGFLGSALLKHVSRLPGFKVRACTSRLDARFPENIVDSVVVVDRGQNTNWQPALVGVKCVVHTAAKVHVVSDKGSNSLVEYRQANVDATLNLARQASQLGVNRFVFISSIKVNGEGTQPGVPYTPDDIPAPTDSYGVSKYEAEEALLQLAAETGMEVVIIRPPLVYGPGVRANFYNMMYWLYKRVPLPLGAIHNKRSLVSIDNLINLIVTCIDHPGAVDQVFLVSDGEDLSTTELLRRLGDALGKPARLLAIPSRLVELGVTVLGRRVIAHRLCGSLQVDISKTHKILGWYPPVSVDDALRRTAEYFLKNHCK